MMVRSYEVGSSDLWPQDNRCPGRQVVMLLLLNRCAKTSNLLSHWVVFSFFNLLLAGLKTNTPQTTIFEAAYRFRNSLTVNAVHIVPSSKLYKITIWFSYFIQKFPVSYLLTDSSLPTKFYLPPPSPLINTRWLFLFVQAHKIVLKVIFVVQYDKKQITW